MALIMFFIALYLLGLYVVYKAVGPYRKMREVRKHVTIPISVINGGKVEIRGWVRPVRGSLLISPLSRNPCIYYHVVVEKNISTRNGSKWITVYSKGDSLDLILADNTGSVPVHPSGAEFNGAEEIHYETSMFQKPGPNLMAFLEREEIRHKGIFGLMRDTMRYTEYYMPGGGYLYVLGHASPAGPDWRLDDEQGQMPFIIHKGRKDEQLIISDRGERYVLGRYRRRFLLLLISAIMIFLSPLLVYILVRIIPILFT